MPESKFTWPRLKEHLRKFFWIYLIGIVVCVAGTNLIWTTTAPRIPYDQSVVVLLADGYSNTEALSGVAKETLVRTQADDPTLQLVEFQPLQYVGPEDYASQMLMVTRLSISEADALMASEAAMETLVNMNAVLPLDDAWADGWMEGRGLEPYYATVTDEETGEERTFLAGMRLDSVDALTRLSAFNNEGAFLCVTINSENEETSLKALEHMIDVLEEF